MTVDVSCNALVALICGCLFWSPEGVGTGGMSASVLVFVVAGWDRMM